MQFFIVGYFIYDFFGFMQDKSGNIGYPSVFRAKTNATDYTEYTDYCMGGKGKSLI